MSIAMTGAFAPFVRKDLLALWMFSMVFLFVSGLASAQGELDLDFSPGTPNSSVHAIAEQGDGKILVGGTFSNINNIPRQRLARLNADGSVDLSFVVDASAAVEAIALQADGRILIGGQFTKVGGQSRSRIARLHPDGTVDAEFNPGCSGAILTFALQADGKILVGGQFSEIAGVERANLARLHADGTADDTFDPEVNNTVMAIAPGADGKPLIGGAFSEIGWQAAPRLARLFNEPATSELAVNGTEQITWLRGGSAAEISNVRFEYRDGAEWVDAGPGGRIEAAGRRPALRYQAPHGSVRAAPHPAAGTTPPAASSSRLPPTAGGVAANRNPPRRRNPRERKLCCGA